MRIDKEGRHRRHRRKGKQNKGFAFWLIMFMLPVMAGAAIIFCLPKGDRVAISGEELLVSAQDTEPLSGMMAEVMAEAMTEAMTEIMAETSDTGVPKAMAPDVPATTVKENSDDINGAAGMEVSVKATAKRLSAAKILIAWDGVPDAAEYVIMRNGLSANAASGEWEEIGSVLSSQAPVKEAADAGYGHGFVDILASGEPVQYKYRIDTRSAEDGTLHTGAEESAAVASNVIICIDPGHYKKNLATPGDDMYGYEEGIFTIKVGLALREELAKYGIDSYLTRETDDITIAGYTNDNLDRGHVALRGEYAAESNLFISLHTNANGENANGRDTWQQPLEINKTVVIVNEPATRSGQAIAIANGIGEAVTAANYRRGLSFTDRFKRVGVGSVREWTSDFNDSSATEGTVCYRWGTDGDYYGVLRGAANAGVPGIIVEHGYHTVAEVRRQAMTENLAEEWAKADADGIAEGLGFF